MAYETQLYTNTLSNQNISSALLVGTYTNTSRIRKVYVNVVVDQVAGNGSYTAYVTRQLAGAGSAYQVQPITTATVASGVTSIAFNSIAVLLNSTDVLKIYVLGLAGDTTTPDITVDVNEEFIFTDASGRIDVGSWLGTAVATPTLAGVPIVDPSYILRRATAQAGAAGTITLDASANATDNYYRGTKLAIVSGTGAGQARIVLSYVGSTKVATVSPNWITNPDNTSVFEVLPIGSVNVEAWESVVPSVLNSGLVQSDVEKWLNGTIPAVNVTGVPKVDIVDLLGTASQGAAGYVALDFAEVLPTAPVANSLGEALFFADIIGGRINTAQAGAATTITLDAGASADSTSYIGDEIYLYGGTGGGIRGTGQRRTIVAYNGATKVATVNRAWSINPDNTSKFMTLPAPWSNVGILEGTLIPSPATAGILDVNTKNYNNQTAQTDANNLPKVDLEYWRATQPSTLNSGAVQADIERIVNAAVDTTLAQLGVNVVKMNAVAASSITTINANQGTTQPINFTGTGAAALTKSDLIDIASAVVNTALAQLGVNVVSQANIDFGALQKASLNAATPASLVGDVGGKVLGGGAGVLSGVGVQADVEQWRTSVPDVLSSGKVPADLKLWLTVAPLALSSQLVQAIVNAYASGQAPLQPTVAGRTLDVSVGGEAGLDWANIGTPSATENLSATTIKTVTDAVTVGNVTLAASQPNYAPAKATDILSDATPFAGANIGTINTNVATLISRVGAFTGSGVNTLLGFLRAMANKAVGIATPTDLSTGGTFTNTADSLEAIAGSESTPPTVQQIVNGVWNEANSSHVIAGSTGKNLSNAGSGSDPWVTMLPDGYTIGEAGFILGNLSAATFPVGAHEVSWQIINSVTSQPIDGAKVWITTDVGGTNVVWSGHTNAFGYAININHEKPFLDTGVYYGWVQDSNFSDTNPTTLNVS